MDSKSKQSPPATPQQHQQVHLQQQLKQQGPKLTIQQNLVQSMQQIDVRMKRHPELQPYVPSDRDRLMIKNKKETSANGSGGPNAKPKLVQRKYVSMNRINQLAQPKKVVPRNPPISSTSNSTSTSTTTSLPAEDEDERRRKAEEDEDRRRRKALEDEERRRRAEDEQAEAEKRRLEEEEAEKRKAEEDEERRRKAEEEEERRRKAEEELRRKAEQEEEERKSRSLLVESILSKFNQSS